MVLYKKLPAETITTIVDTNALHAVVRVIGDTVPDELNSNIAAALFEVINTNTNVKANPIEIKGGGVVFNEINSVDIPNIGKGTVYLSDDGNLILRDENGDGYILGGPGSWALGAGGDTLYYNQGNVGIGDSAPESKLTVIGGVHIGTSTDAGDSNLIVDGSIYVGDTVTFGSSLTVGDSRLVSGDVYSKVVFPTGDSDNIALQAANDALTNGGTIQLAEGDTAFVLDTPVILSSDVTVLGTRSRGSRITGKGFQIGDTGDSTVSKTGIIGCWFEDMDEGYCIDVHNSAAMIYDNIMYDNDRLRGDSILYPAININATANRTRVMNNYAEDNGNLIDRGNCESATSPMFAGDTVIVAATNATWAKSTALSYEGAASWLLTKTSAGGGGHASQHLQDGTATNDMHGLVAGLPYALFAYGNVPVAGDISRYYLFLSEYYAAAWHENITIQMTGAAAWELLTDSVTLNAGTTGIKLWVYIEQTEAVDSLFYIDNIRVQPLGVHNEHENQIIDAGTSTYLSGNSWQNPFGA